MEEPPDRINQEQGTRKNNLTELRDSFLHDLGVFTALKGKIEQGEAYTDLSLQKREELLAFLTRAIDHVKRILKLFPAINVLRFMRNPSKQDRRDYEALYKQFEAHVAAFRADVEAHWSLVTGEKDSDSLDS